MKRFLLIAVLLFSAYFFVQGQDGFNCEPIEKIAGHDIMIYDEYAMSFRIMSDNIFRGGEVIYCPAGIKRSSRDDVKRRWSFKWMSKYNNLYFKTSDGLIIEGMNEHGFSASLMLLQKSNLPEKENELIPIAASMAINFFIDHFKSVDTALLAVWDTRIYDDLGAGCGWPFRITLHDSSGATAYIEHIDGKLSVYTPETPAIICDGPAYDRLLMVKYITDSIPLGQAESDFIDLDEQLKNDSDVAETLVDSYSESHLKIYRSHELPSYRILYGDSVYYYIFDIKEFDPASETSVKIF
jgi:hypothetical protein